MSTLNIQDLHDDHNAEAFSKANLMNLEFWWMEDLQKQQDCFESAQQVSLDRLNIMQIDLTSSQKAMHKLLAIVKQTAVEKKVSFGCEIELISQLATCKTNCAPKSSSMP